MPFAISTVAITVVFIVMVRLKEIEGIKVLFRVLDYGFDIIGVLRIVGFTLFGFAFAFTSRRLRTTNPAYNAEEDNE